MVTAGVVDVDATSSLYSLPAEHAAMLTRAAGADNVGVWAQLVPMQARELNHKGRNFPSVAFVAQTRVPSRPETVVWGEIPVFHKGAQFYVGDPHSAQGDGEVNGTAIEHSLTGTIEFVLHKRRALTGPRAENATHYIVMGIDLDLDRAMRLAPSTRWTSSCARRD
jgi:Acetamidase/Formamidase family